MLKDEFNRLMNLFAQGAEGQAINLEEVFRQSLAFFEHLNVQLQKGSQEEKKEALMMMSEMYTQMMQETKKICEKTGMSEEQLTSYAENPSNFSPEQWSSIQEARKKMLSAGQNLAKSVSAMDPGAARKTGDSSPSAPASKEGEPKKSGHVKKSKKNQWMRS
ncbi:MAG: hypothetical protein JSR39_02260 [Verrucomicrobia bacterium]|nr:hypothetical protein [Verrucomicrobiota bacterium]